MVRLCSDLGLKEAQQYSLELRKAEKAVEAKLQRQLSGNSGKESMESRVLFSTLSPSSNAGSNKKRGHTPTGNIGNCSLV